MTGLSGGPLTAAIVLGVLELGLDIVALVILARTPRERVTLPKVVWVLLIVLVNLIGSVLFLAIGRRPAAVADPRLGASRIAGGSGAHPSPDAVADALYGSRADAAQQRDGWP